MTRTNTTAKAAAGVVAGVSGVYGLLLGEILLTRKRIGTTDELPPNADAVYGVDLPGRPVRVLLLGDSAAVGYGMTSADTTPPALIGEGLAQLLDAPIDIRSVAKVGARSSDLAAQIEAGAEHRPDLAIIVIGTNDVTHQTPTAVSGRRLAQAIRRLRSIGAEVIVGTCPDLGAIKRLPQPLRAAARAMSKRMARAQLAATVQAGGRPVVLADLLGPLFVSMGDLLVGEDRFHPSEYGYATMASFLNAAAAAAWRDRGHDLVAA